MIRAQMDRNWVIDDLEVMGRNPEPPGERAIVFTGWNGHGTVSVVVSGPDLVRLKDILDAVMGVR